MSIFNDKATKSVAEAAAKIMEAELSAKQKQIAKIAEPKHKIDAGDLAKLRAGHKPVKEETEEQIDEASYSAKAARAGKDIGKPGKMFAKIAKKAEASGARSGEAVAGAVLKKLRKEDVDTEVEEVLQEYESKDGVYKHKGTYGTAKGAEYGSTEWDKEEKEAKKTPKASRKLGARQNYVRSTRVNESFTEMIASYKENGLKSLASFETIQEEPDNEQFTKEFEDQKASMEGKKKPASVAAAATQGVKQMPEEIEVIDANEINGVKVDTIEERTLTEPETKKKEEVVKSMKKGLSGFKQRYGERAKSVLYATATRIAKEKA